MAYKGSYIVNENGERPITFKDHSFKLCVGTMIMFIFLCIILITASLLFWNKNNTNTDKLLGMDSNAAKSGLEDKRSENVKNESKPSEKEYSTKLNKTANVDTKPNKNSEMYSTTRANIGTKITTVPTVTKSDTRATTTEATYKTTVIIPTKLVSTVITTVPTEEMNLVSTTESEKSTATNKAEDETTVIIPTKSVSTAATTIPKYITSTSSTTESGKSLTSAKADKETIVTIPTKSELTNATTTPKDEAKTTSTTESKEPTTTIKNEDETTVFMSTKSGSTGATTLPKDVTNTSSTTESRKSPTSTKAYEETTVTMPTKSELTNATTTPKDEAKATSTTESKEPTTTIKNEDETTVFIPTKSETTAATTLPKDVTNTSSTTESGKSLTSTKAYEETTVTIPTKSELTDARTTPKYEAKATSTTESKEPTTTIKNEDETTVFPTKSGSTAATTLPKDVTNTSSTTESGKSPTSTKADEETTVTIPTKSVSTAATTIPKYITSTSSTTESGKSLTSAKADKETIVTIPTKSELTDATTTPKDEAKATSTTESKKPITITMPEDETTIITLTKSSFSDAITLSYDLEANVCKTGTCKNTASRMLSLMDHTANPCDDFYQYACGGMANNRIEEKNLETNVTNILEDVEKLKENPSAGLKILNIFYMSCIEEKETVKLDKTIFDDLQKDLIHTDLARNKPTNLAILLANILRNHPHHTPGHPFPIFDIIVDADLDNHFIPVITQPFYPSILKNADNNDIYKKECYNYLYDKNNFIVSYENYKNCTKHSILYKKNINAAFKYFNILDIKSKDIDDLNDVLKSSSTRIKVDIDRNAYESDAIYYTYGELKAKYPVINWELLLQKLFVRKTITDKQSIKILTPKYFIELMEFYELKDFDKIKEIILGIVAHDLYLEFVVPKVYDRKSYCKEIMVNFLDDIVFYKYKEEILNKNSYLDASYKEANDLFQKIKDKMSDLLDEYAKDNLNSDEAMKLKQKLKDIRLVIDTKTLYNYRAINSIYGKLLLSKDDFIANVIALKRNLRSKMYSNFNENITKDELIWQHFTSPLATEPFVHIDLNVIVVSPIILFDLLPSYGNDRKQRYQQMADFGFLLGQQLATFFTPINIKKILTTYPEDYDSFIIQLNSLPTLNVEYYDEKLTIEETSFSAEKRFTDDSGFNLLFQVLSDDNETLSDIENNKLPWIYKDFDNKQLFFILLAQNFCERKEKLTKQNYILNLYENDELQKDIRVNSMISNSKPMKNVFHCGRGTNMTPDSKFGQFPDIKISKFDYEDE